jgi:PAS domain S-box-containing protein
MHNDCGNNGRKKQKQIVREEDLFQQILLHLATGFINLPIGETDAAIDNMLKKIGEYTGLDRVYVFKHDKDNQVTSNTHEWCAEGIAPEIENLQEIPFDYFTDMLEIWQKGEVVSIPCVAQLPHVDLIRTILENQGIKSLLLIPLLYDNDNFGFVGFDAVREIRIFNEKETTLLKLLAEILSNALSRQQTEEALRESENKYRYLADNISDIVWVTDHNLQKTYVSPSVEAILGFTTQEAQNQTLQETATPESYQQAMEIFAKETANLSAGSYDATHPIIFEMEFYRKNDTPLVMEVNCKPLLNAEGGLEGIYGVSRDVSERKKAEAALRESEDKFRGFVENSQDIIFMLNDQGCLTYVSPSWKRLLGYETEKVEGRPFTDFLYAEDIPRCLQFQAQVLANERQGESIEYRVNHKDGSVKWHASNGSIIKTGGRYTYIGVARDITEKKQAENALKDSEEKFRLLADNMSDIVWIMDMQLRRTYVSPSVEMVLGFTPEESMRQTIDETLAPESVNHVIEVFRNELENATSGPINDTHTVMVEAEYYHKNGSTIWMESNCKPLLDKEGKVLGIYGASRDITDRVKAQKVIIDEKAFQEILLSLSTGFINVPLHEIDASISQMLEQVGFYAKVDRVYVFRHDYIRGLTSNTHEWCRDGITSVRKVSQEVPLKPFAEMLEIHRKGDIINLPDAPQLKDEHPIKTVLVQQGIKSLVLIPLLQAGENIGFVGFDTVKEKRVFTDREINLLIVLTEIISNALSRQQAEEILLAQKEQLAGWNQVLEMTVQERTAAVRNLLDNAGQGFLTTDSNLVVNEEYSAECLNIFGEPIGGKELTELLFPGDLEGRETFKEISAQINIEKDQRKSELYLSLLPEEIILDGCHIAISYKIIESRIDLEQVDLLMLILTDITEKRKLEAHLEEERQLFEMVVRVVSNHMDFNATLREYRQYCRTCSEELLHGGTPYEVLTEHYRRIHTFKGAFHQFGMLNMVKKLHVLETRLIQYQEASRGDLSLSHLSSLMARDVLESWITEDLDHLKKILGDSLFLQDNTLIINAESLRELEKRIIDTLSPLEIKLLLPEVRKLSWKPLRDQFKVYQEYVSRIAAREGKMVYPLEIEGGEMRADPERYRNFIRNLGHIFRNAVDHGIEIPEERIAAGKDISGRITCSVIEDKGCLVVTVSDDGSGLACLEIEAVPESFKGTALVDIIFEDGYSTVQKASDLSGRGIGMSAIKSAVDKLGGSVEVSSVPGKGTTFRFILPGYDRFADIVPELIEDFSDAEQM